MNRLEVLERLKEIRQEIQPESPDDEGYADHYAHLTDAIEATQKEDEGWLALAEDASGETFDY